MANKVDEREQELEMPSIGLANWLTRCKSTLYRSKSLLIVYRPNGMSIGKAVFL